MSKTCSDERLVAYLDGQLSSEDRRQVDANLADDPALQQRLEMLMHSDLPFQGAYASLLDQAPMERMSRMLEVLPTPLLATSLNRRLFLATAAGFLVAGVAVDRLFLHWMEDTEEKTSNWRALVADYMSLYIPQTLEHLPVDPAAQLAQLQIIDQRLGLPLTPAQLELEQPRFKRAQLLEYDGVPIAQITYLDPLHGPFALCITRSNNGPQAPAHEVRHGMNIVYWSGLNHAYLVIGRNSPEELEGMAVLLRSRLDA